MKIVAFGMVLILLSASTIWSLGSSQVFALLTPCTFAFYYPWCGTPNVSGYWYHWNDANHNPDNFVHDRRDIAATNYPWLDVYDSNDETVIEQHVNWSKEAGIGCLIVSWFGKNDFTDNASKHIMNVCEKENFNFTFYYENTTSSSQTVNDFTYLWNTYGRSRSFYKIDGRPVIFVYSRARDNLNANAWIWHACTDSIGIDEYPNKNETASTKWMLSEDVRRPPRFGVIPFQPFKSESGYVESANPITLQSDKQYWLHVGVSCIRNDSTIWSDVGIRIKIGTDNSCNVTLNPEPSDQIVSFGAGWQDWTFNISSFAGHEVYIRAESYNGGLVNWSSEWAAIDCFYIADSSGEIVSSDPYLDNGWKQVMGDMRTSVVNPYVIMDFGGYEDKVRDFMDYFANCIDGIHDYNPIGIFNEDQSKLSSIYGNASEGAHYHNKTFIATVVPGFNNTVASNYSPESFNSAVGRQGELTYRLFWQIANDSRPDGYAITSFNEWHEATEIEPSREYGSRYLNITSECVNQYITKPEQEPQPASSFPIGYLYLTVAVAVIASVGVVAIVLRKRKHNHPQVPPPPSV